MEELRAWSGAGDTYPWVLSLASLAVSQNIHDQILPAEAQGCGETMSQKLLKGEGLLRWRPKRQQAGPVPVGQVPPVDSQTQGRTQLSRLRAVRI